MTKCLVVHQLGLHALTRTHSLTHSNMHTLHRHAKTCLVTHSLIYSINQTNQSFISFYLLSQFTHSCTHLINRTQPRTHTHTHTHIRTHIRAHARTHRRKHTQLLSCSQRSFNKFWAET